MGKTTLLNCLAGTIPGRERVVTCKEVFELAEAGLHQSSGRRRAPCAGRASDRATALPSQPAVIVRHNDVGEVSTRPWADPFDAILTRL